MRIPLPVLTAVAVLLASTSLGALFSDPGWILPSMGAIAVAVLMGALARWLPLSGAWRAVAGLILSIAGFLCFATAVLVPATGILGVVPGTSTPDAFRALSDQASSDIHDLLVPIPAAPGVALFAMAGCYLTAAVTDLLVSGFRRPALAGFPLLILFAVPAGLSRNGAGWFAFVATSVGYLILLHADGRAAIWRWGHPVLGSSRRSEPAETAVAAAGARGSSRWLPASAVTGRRIGALSIAGALVLPVVLPIGTSTWLASARSNGGRTVTVPPLVDISARLHQHNDTDLLHVTSNRPQYLRLTALDVFTGGQFDYLKQQVGDQRNLDSELADTTFEGTTAENTGVVSATSALRERFLPLPFETRAVDVDGAWRFAPASSTVFSTTSDTSSLTWSFDALVPNPSKQELRASGPPSEDQELAVDLSLPDHLDPKIKALAVSLGNQAGPNAYDRAVAIQQYLRSDAFAYDLNGAPTGSDALSEFLFVSHTGFCQQFASAMAVLARELRIPARVAIGFTAGRPSGHNTYTVTSADAHAWPELYFQGVGWVPFEPTPRGDGQAVEPAYSIPDQGPTGAGNPGAPGQGTDPIPTKGQTQPNRNPAGTTTQATSAPSTGQSWWWVAPAAGVTFILLLLVPMSGRARLRRRRQQRSQAGQGELEWQELIDTATDLGIEPDATQSPRRIGQQLGLRLDGSAADAVQRLALTEERRRYAPAVRSESASAIPRTAGFNDVAVVSAGLRQSVPRRARMWALVFPRSWFRWRASVRRAAGSLRRLAVTGRRVGPAGS